MKATIHLLAFWTAAGYEIAIKRKTQELEILALFEQLNASRDVKRRQRRPLTSGYRGLIPLKLRLTFALPGKLQ